MAILRAQNIEKAYRRSGQADTTVLRGASLDVERGEFVALVGPSGAGKSTLLHILASLEPPDAGDVVMNVDGNIVSLIHTPASQLAAFRNRHIGMVFQFHHLLPEFTARENVMMPGLIAGHSTSDVRRIADGLLERVGVYHRADHMPSELSGGEQARVAIARALVNSPSLLIADEPTGNLDSVNAAAVIQLLTDLQSSSGITCVIATHSDDLASRAQRIVQMKDGICTS